MSETQIDTPRTDAERGWPVCNFGPSKSDYLLTDKNGKFVAVDFAEKLELELAAANAYINRLEKAGDRMDRTLRDEGWESVGQNMWKEAKESKP